MTVVYAVLHLLLCRKCCVTLETLDQCFHPCVTKSLSLTLTMQEVLSDREVAGLRKAGMTSLLTVQSRLRRSHDDVGKSSLETYHMAADVPGEEKGSLSHHVQKLVLSTTLPLTLHRVPSSTCGADYKQQAYFFTTQAEVAELEAHVDKLQRQLEESELDCVNTKAQVATLTGLMASGSLPQALQEDDMARTEDGRAQDSSSAVHPDPWDISAHECDEVTTCAP